MELTFSNRRVVVTGGTGALGTAVVGTLLEAGASCVVPCYNTGELADFPHTDHDAVRVIKNVNLTEEAQVERLYADAASAGPLWASIHIAGGFAMGPIEQTSKNDFLKQVNMNALTCFLCCREAVRHLRGAGGRIVNVTARPALEPRTGANMVAYTAAKSAVAAITAALAEEVAGDDILVNAIAPSIMDTPANRSAMPDADHNRWPTTRQVAATVAFLASPQNVVTRGGIAPVYGRS